MTQVTVQRAGTPLPVAGSDDVRSRAAAAAASQEATDAWVQEGVIDPTDRIVRILAGEDLTILIGDTPYRPGEDESLLAFRGEIAPPGRVVRSSTFAAHALALSRYLNT